MRPPAKWVGAQKPLEGSNPSVSAQGPPSTEGGFQLPGGNPSNNVGVTKIAIATKHKKDELLAPLFRNELGWQLELVEFDTDTLGTFSPEIKRALSPKDAALAKARIALENSDADYGLGSEGSIYPHPYLPMVSLDTEVLALVGRANHPELVLTHTSSEIVAVNRVLDSGVELEAFAKLADLPNHAVILRTADAHYLIKGIREPEHLRELLDGEAKGLPNLILESDFRAMSSPSRSKNILACAQKLVERWKSACPACRAPGWGSVGFDFGLPCSDCGTINQEAIRQERYGCTTCAELELFPAADDSVSPSQCQVCNP